MLGNRGRAGAALCAATVVALTTCLGTAPAQAATSTSAVSSTTSSDPLGGLGDVLGGVGTGLGTVLGGVGDGLGTIVGGVVGGVGEVVGGLTGSTGTPTPSASPSSTGATSTTSPAASGSTASGSTTGIGAGLTSGVGEVLGGVTTGVGQVLGGVTDGVGAVLGGLTGTGGSAPGATDDPSPAASSTPAPTPAASSTPAPTQSGSVQDPAAAGGATDPDPQSTTAATGEPAPEPSGTASTGTSSDSPARGESALGVGGSTQAVPVSAVAVTSSVSTLYPAGDGYRDEVVFSVRGTTADGSVQAVTGTAALTFGAMTVATWPITSTNQQITWKGLIGSRIKAGRYVLTAVVTDGSGGSLTAIKELDVSAQKLATATATVKSKAVSGVQAMATKAKAGLSKGKVVLRIKTVAHGVKGTQYLVLTHGTKRIEVRIRNGKHTSKAVTLPASFTTYRITHTWKGHAVRLTSASYAYSYKQLR